MNALPPKDVHYLAYVRGREDGLRGLHLEMPEEQCVEFRRVEAGTSVEIRRSYALGYVAGHARRMLRLADTWPFSAVYVTGEGGS